MHSRRLHLHPNPSGVAASRRRLRRSRLCPSRHPSRMHSRLCCRSHPHAGCNSASWTAASMGDDLLALGMEAWRVGSAGAGAWRRRIVPHSDRWMRHPPSTQARRRLLLYASLAAALPTLSDPVRAYPSDQEGEGCGGSVWTPLHAGSAVSRPAAGTLHQAAKVHTPVLLRGQPHRHWRGHPGCARLQEISFSVLCKLSTAAARLTQRPL
ncbi:hypothetical protein C2845_PM06G24170 [Panicum miliaceum]|uniref:Uncharacterized protein n=1 Tax=Panicum miliaceum TaxID=4540 RepID=A0A3L6REW4_PANMI|nr:hypothetical protein C2845_PM06G24170 [Panicum miliaceum]